jgi:hypothetical protein
MRLVETDIQRDDDVGHVTTPPRPEHRRVYTSLLFTFSVLAATVTAVYVLFPPRDNELLTVALANHRSQGNFEITAPGDNELLAWGVGAVGRGAPFPSGSPEVSLVGVRTVRILNRPAAMARYEMSGQPISYFVMRAHDAPPRRYQRQEGDVQVVSWRRGRWTLVAAGPADTRPAWAKFVGAP